MSDDTAAPEACLAELQGALAAERATLAGRLTAAPDDLRARAALSVFLFATHEKNEAEAVWAEAPADAAQRAPGIVAQVAYAAADMGRWETAKALADRLPRIWDGGDVAKAVSYVAYMADCERDPHWPGCFPMSVPHQERWTRFPRLAEGIAYERSFAARIDGIFDGEIAIDIEERADTAEAERQRSTLGLRVSEFDAICRNGRAADLIPRDRLRLGGHRIGRFGELFVVGEALVLVLFPEGGALFPAVDLIDYPAVRARWVRALNLRMARHSRRDS